MCVLFFTSIIGIFSLLRHLPDNDLLFFFSLFNNILVDENGSFDMYIHGG